MWRLVMENVATLEEMERAWTLADIVRGNHVLTLREEARRPVEEP